MNGVPYNNNNTHDCKRLSESFTKGWFDWIINMVSSSFLSTIRSIWFITTSYLTQFKITPNLRYHPLLPFTTSNGFYHKQYTYVKNLQRSIENALKKVQLYRYICFKQRNALFEWVNPWSTLGPSILQNAYKYLNQ